MKNYPGRGTQKEKALVCRSCGMNYIGHHLSKECDACIWKECAAPECSNKLKRHSRRSYCSDKCKAASPMANKMSPSNRVSVICPCGKNFPKYGEDTHRSGGRGKRYCSEECRKKYTRSGDRFRNNPEEARRIGSLPKPNHGLRGHKQSEEHLIKRLGTTAIRASKEELSLVPALSKLGFRHTGEGAFWRRWKDGTLHNPDFVNEERHVVVEYFGSYWHDKDRGREAEIQQAWAEIGWDCLIIWSDEREGFLADPMVWGF